MRIHMHIYTQHARIHTYICMCMYMCMHTNTPTHPCIHIYIYIHRNTFQGRMKYYARNTPSTHTRRNSFQANSFHELSVPWSLPLAATRFLKFKGPSDMMSYDRNTPLPLDATRFRQTHQANAPWSLNTRLLKSFVWNECVAALKFQGPGP